jgi:hypothetical protein
MRSPLPSSHSSSGSSSFDRSAAQRSLQSRPRVDEVARKSSLCAIGCFSKNRTMRLPATMFSPRTTAPGIREIQCDPLALVATFALGARGCRPAHQPSGRRHALRLGGRRPSVQPSGRRHALRLGGRRPSVQPSGRRPTSSPAVAGQPSSQAAAGPPSSQAVACLLFE